MSVSRVSSNFMINQGIYDIETSMTQQTQLEAEVDSGKTIQTAGDNPVGLSQVLQLNDGMNQNQQYTDAINQGTSETSITDSTLTSISNLVQNANTLAVTGANGTESQSNMNALATQVGSYISQLMELGNTTSDGTYIFSGFNTDTPPFSQGTNGIDVNYNGTPNTENSARQIQIGANTAVTINVNGQDLLGNVTSSGGTLSGSGLFYDLTKLQQDLQNGDSSGITSDITALQNDQQTVATYQGQIGAVENQLSLANTTITSLGTSDQQQLNNIEGANLPDAISQLNFEQNVYSASLDVMAKIESTSLLQYLS
jgi:flagellar hook-associated protein 3 FlgL